MARNFSSRAKRNVNATSAGEPLIELIEITHRDLAVPARFANDTADIAVEGSTFVACRFDLSIPDDKDGQVSSAKLEVDNIGRELTQWLEVSQGGAGAKCRLIMVLRSNPSNLEFDMTMDLTGLSITNTRVGGDMGFKNTLMQSAVTMRYDPTTTPGIF
ncbi:hypothetical protein LMG26858_04434 [Achromobacter anxifer]|uniref:DUF1833 domain-containing protein n=1 Tax=Achromobacter anxifer TaxID=1287737 RepID=A0A6S7ECQ8_9BURK|nr:DUF1833 family protein [Achromobacter anxifer]CAB3904983.1 hypothetical protein LMG26858_04434 [Achromobacter anxifer]CAB5512057.1 hypothetical protein LMG26857_01346 [Achromobacter anxifer]